MLDIFIGKAVFICLVSFSQLGIEITGEVLFPQDGPPKFSTQIEKFHRFAEEDSCSINVKVIKNGLRFDGFGYSQAAAHSQWEKRAQGHFARDRLRCGPCPAALRAPVVAPRP